MVFDAQKAHLKINQSINPSVIHWDMFLNHLWQVFDGVDIVMRGRTNQADARDRVTRLGDLLRYLEKQKNVSRYTIWTFYHLPVLLKNEYEKNEYLLT